MAKKKKSKRRLRRPAVIGRSIRLSARGWRRQRVKQATSAAPPDGAYQPPPLPSGVAEFSENGQSPWPHPIFFVIVAAGVAFIAAVAWLIAHAPAR
jgi:hypothetical protein